MTTPEHIEAMEKGLLRTVVNTVEILTEHKVTDSRRAPNRFYFVPHNRTELCVVEASELSEEGWSEKSGSKDFRIDANRLQDAYRKLVEIAREKNPELFITIAPALMGIVELEETPGYLDQDFLDRETRELAKANIYGVVFSVEDEDGNFRCVSIVHKKDFAAVDSDCPAVKWYNSKYSDVMGDWRFHSFSDEETAGHPFKGVLFHASHVAN